MKLILCADDFGQTEAIDQAIIQLIEKKRLSATSCMTLSPRWQASAKQITASIKKQAAIGLHLDFTHFGQAYAHPKLIALSYARLLNKMHIRNSINLQLDRFETALGMMPDYIDGHQHVHQLPQIRDVLLDVLNTRYTDNKPWLRIAKPPLNEGFKGLMIRLLGANALARKAQKSGINYADCLLGVYGFVGNSEAYKGRFLKWIQDLLAIKSEKAPILMCHPSLTSDDQDVIYKARLTEFEVFNSEFMDLAIKQNGIQLVKSPS